MQYSKLKLVVALQSRSLWSHAKDWMESNGYYDLFVAAQELSSEYPAFSQAVAALQQELGISGDLVSEILSEAAITSAE